MKKKKKIPLWGLTSGRGRDDRRVIVVVAVLAVVAGVLVVVVVVVVQVIQVDA